MESECVDMTAKIKTIPFFGAMMLSVVTYSAQPFERYQTVIDRKPFGPEPVNFDPESAPGSAAAAAAAGDEMTEEQRTVEEQQLAALVQVAASIVEEISKVSTYKEDYQQHLPYKCHLYTLFASPLIQLFAVRM